MLEPLSTILDRIRGRAIPYPDEPGYFPMPEHERCGKCHLNLLGTKEQYIEMETWAASRDLRVDDCFCRCAEKAQAELDLRAGAANLPAKTFETWEKRKGTEDALLASRLFVAEEAGLDKHIAKILMLVGPRGTGKSHLLAAIGHARLQRGDTVRYEQTTELLDRVKATYDRREGHETTSEVLDQYHGVKVLLLDDLGTEKDTEWAESVLTSLIDDRYRNGRWLVVTTNMKNRAEMEKKYPRIADRLFDHRTGTVKQVTLTCSSYRTG